MQLARRLTHALVLVLTLVIGATAAAIIVSQTAWFKNWIRAYIVREANLYLNGTLSIERLGGNLLFGLQMENIDVSMDGRQVVAVKDMGLDYNVWDFVTKGLSVDNIRLDKPVIYLRREGDTWTLSRLIKKQEWEANRRGPERPITIEDIGISDGTFVIDGAVGTSGVDVPKRIDHVDAKLAFKYEPVHYSIDISHVSFRGSEPAIALNALSGAVAVREDAVYIDKVAIRTAEMSMTVDGAVQQYLTNPVYNLHVSSDKLSVPELAQIFPVLAGVRLQPQFDVKVGGPADRLGVELNAVSSAGRLHTALVVNVSAPSRSVTGDVSVRHLDLGPILNDSRRRSDITADARLDLRGESLTDVRSLRGTVTVDAPRIATADYEVERVHGVARLEGRDVVVDARGAAYGAAATAKGRVVLPEGKAPLAYDLRGHAQHVDLRKLPRAMDVPRAATDVNADYHAAGTDSASNVELRFDPSTIAGAKIAKDGTAELALGRAPIAYKTDVTVSDLDLQRVGEQFQIPTLAADRFQSAINGHIVASGHAANADEMDVTAQGTIVDSAVLGGRVETMTFDSTVAHDTAHVKTVGTFADFDPASLSERPELKGRVGGTLDVDLTVAHASQGVTPDNLEATGTIALQPSTIGDLAITNATVDGTYHNSTADLRSLAVTGPDLNVQAKGTLALSETGSSNLTVNADTPNLEAIGKILNQPLAGIAKVDATVTGNRRLLEASGHVIANGVKYGDTADALTLASDFTAKVPELTVADAAATANGHATFVTIEGQNINEIDGKLDFQQQQLGFDVTAKQPQRSLGAAGSLLVHPDHHEVHLQRLALEAGGQTWQLAPGSAPTINYAPDAVTVKDLKLASANQSISADGSYGKPADALHVTLTNVDVANIDALLLRPPQLSGRLNATATVHAPESQDGAAVAPTLKQVPQVEGDFRITDGGFRQFRYAAFGGTVQYRGKGMTVDTKLEQSPSTFITAKGYVPTAAFTAASSGERETAHDADVAPEDRVDLHIESTPIDLGLVQGFTTELTNVSGTMQAKIDVTGAAADPHPTGLITFQKGAFTVQATGVPYNNVEGKIELQPDRVHVGAISALDNHFNSVTISGDLAVHEREVGDVQVFVHTDDFKVIDNKMGNLRVNTDLRIAGELRAPRVEGDLGFTSGRIDLDRVLAQIGESAYATAPIEYAPAATEPSRKVPDAFDMMKALTALSMNVHVTVPDDLIVKAADLQAPGSPVSLGAITVILGGDVRATKSPGGEIALVGLVNTVRGTYTFQGRRFDILRDGFVRFTGEPLRDMDPTLDIATRRNIQAVEARVNVRGTLRQPEIVLSSTPPLEQADILSLILFNQPANTLGETQQMSLVSQAQYLAGSSLTNALSQSVASALNLTEFDINLAPESGTGPQVRVGQQVGQNVYLRLEQGIGDQSQTNVVLEFELKKWLRLQTNVLQGSTTQQQLFQRMQGSGVNLLFFFSY